jgi:uncharacterized coiled-coil protein SlyX
MAQTPNLSVGFEIDSEAIQRLSDVITEFTDTVDRLEKALQALASPTHVALVNQLTDERFKSVTRG